MVTSYIPEVENKRQPHTSDRNTGKWAQDHTRGRLALGIFSVLWAGAPAWQRVRTRGKGCWGLAFGFVFFLLFEQGGKMKGFLLTPTTPPPPKQIQNRG